MKSTEKNYYTAEDLVTMLGVCKGYAYKLIRDLNGELNKAGFKTISGRVSKKYFNERYYGITS